MRRKRCETDFVAADLDRAAVLREGQDVSLICYGGMVPRTLKAAAELGQAGISAEVIDLRTLRPLDRATILASVTKTRRAVIVDEGWKSGSHFSGNCDVDCRRRVLRARRTDRARVLRRSTDTLLGAHGTSRDSTGGENCLCGEQGDIRFGPSTHAQGAPIRKALSNA
jgi:pyruvate/2-oxoglutarate/acetoin dehydrogenase E1 component